MRGGVPGGGGLPGLVLIFPARIRGDSQWDENLLGPELPEQEADGEAAAAEEPQEQPQEQPAASERVITKDTGREFKYYTPGSPGPPRTAPDRSGTLNPLTPGTGFSVLNRSGEGPGGARGGEPP